MGIVLHFGCNCHRVTLYETLITTGSIKMCTCNSGVADCDQYANKQGTLEKCKFPFTYQGRRWTQCAPRNGKSFCFLSDKRDDWGFCLEKEDQYHSLDNTIVVTNNGNSGSILCYQCRFKGVQVHLRLILAFRDKRLSFVRSELSNQMNPMRF